LMPQGVEHQMKRWHQLFILCVKIPLMPQGVEHQGAPTLEAISNLGEDSIDAARR
jgi:hypothetical protein